MNQHKAVLVTGGGRGIGAATARLLGARGYSVVVNYAVDEVSAQDVVKDIKQHGGQAIAIQADIGNEKQVKALIAEAASNLGVITHLVNNASILKTQSSFEDISNERFQQVLDINVLGTFNVTKYFLAQVPNGGAIVNVSSAASRSGAPFEYVDYAASKGAVDSMTKGLSLELAERNIRVNSVRPGFIYTDMHKDGGEPERVDRLAPNIPLKRGGQPEEVAQAIAWLLSDEASYVTGSFIELAGGK